MAEITTIARPYAHAAFEFAQEQNALSEWSDSLAFVAAVVMNESMAELIQNPRLKWGELVQVIIDVCADRIDDEGRNFLRLMAKNRRLFAIPAIAVEFERLRAEAEMSIEAELIAAMPVDDVTLQKISKALQGKLNRKVKLTCRIDDSLMGGAVIRAGDLVIDGSVRGQLDKLATALN